MPKVNIDLGYSMKELMKPSTIESDEEMYPTFRVESPEKIDFPHEGEMTIKFRKTGSEEHKNHYTCTIEVQKIVSMYPEEGESDEQPYKRDKSTEESLDKLAAERSKRNRSEESDESY